MVTFIDEWRRKFPSCMVVKRLILSVRDRIYTSECDVRQIDYVVIMVIFRTNGKVGWWNVKRSSHIQLIRNIVRVSLRCVESTWTFNLPNLRGSPTITDHLCLHATGSHPSKVNFWKNRSVLCCTYRLNCTRGESTTRQPHTKYTICDCQFGNSDKNRRFANISAFAGSSIVDCRLGLVAQHELKCRGEIGPQRSTITQYLEDFVDFNPLTAGAAYIRVFILLAH